MNRILPIVCTVFTLFSAFLGTAVSDESWQEYVGAKQTALLESSRSIPALFYVSLEGNDSWSGRLSTPNTEKTDGPFRTLEKAKTALREYRTSASFDGKPTVVEVMPGVYELDQTLQFDAADSGTEAAPVIWRGAPAAPNSPPTVFLRGGRNLVGKDNAAGTPVTDPAELARIKPEVRDKVIRFDLRALGITDFGEYNNEQNLAELFCNGDSMTIARYPNTDFLDLEKVDPENNPMMDLRGTQSYTIPKIFVDKEDISAWANEPDAWTLGYWCWDWLSTRHKIVKVDAANKKIELDEPYHEYGYRLGQYYYLYHLLCELDVPGEFYIDNNTGILFFYPPANFEPDTLFLTVLKNDVVGNDLEHFVFTGFGLDGCRETTLVLNGHDIIVSNCLARNAGGSGIAVRGSNSLVFGNHLYNLGARGITMEAGNRETLTSGNSAVINNDIHHYARIVRTYAAGVGFDGCGLLIAHNRITNAPHNAILFGGNNHRIELNEIGSVCEESNDAGAIYSGRNWTMRGNLIKNNYFHDIEGFRKQGAVGIYLDDLFSSIDMVGNLFVNVTAATFIGGGRDSSIVNNIFVNCHPAVRIDGRGMNWQKNGTEGRASSLASSGIVDGIKVTEEPYASAYPELKNALQGKDFHAPEGNRFERNVVIEDAWNQPMPAPFEGDDIYDEARPFVKVTDNVIGDYRLLMSLDKAPTPEIPNTKIHFDRIPTERIGRFNDPAANGRQF